MTRTLLLESIRGETRLAVIEDGRLCELYVERPNGEDVTGSIYLGRVENVVPGMNAAFVDIGQPKNGFLSAGDIQIADKNLTDRLGGLRIERLARPGREMLVQVVKAQSGQKGHRLSCHITLPGRLMVLLTDVSYAGVSKKITDAAERDRLHGAAKALIGLTGMGVIIRTAAEGMPDEALRAEWDSLVGQWREIRLRAAHSAAPKQVFSNTSLTLRCVRDMLDDTVDAVWAEGQALYDELIERAGALTPDKADLIRLHEGQTPLFDLHRVDSQLDKAMGKYVWLKSGGSLVIEQTEAMTVVDVNTAKFTGKKDIEETLFRLNCEAAEELVRQLRLRDLGGIIVVDFIDMKDPGNNDRLVELLRELAKADRNRLTVVGMTGLGLVELTRKKERKPLSQQLMHICSACGGDGMTPSHETTARRAIRELWRRRRGGQMNPLLVTARREITGWMETIGNPAEGAVYVSPNPDMQPGEYTVEPADEASLPENAKRLK